MNILLIKLVIVIHLFYVRAGAFYLYPNLWIENILNDVNIISIKKIEAINHQLQDLWLVT